VAIHHDQHDRRQVLLGELVQRQAETVGLETERLQVALDVQQGEAFLVDPDAVAVCVHLRECRLLGDRIAVLVGQQGGHGGGAATEVVLLPDGVPEFRFLEGGQMQRVGRARTAVDLHRSGQQAAGPGQRQHDRKRREHPAHGLNCTLTMTPVWISTLLPVFWITVGKPTAPLNAPPSIRLDPVTTWLSVLWSTEPLSVMVSVVVSMPPRDCARVEPLTLVPRPST